MSRRIEDLNPIVAAKCRAFIGLCKERGIDILVTSTLRTEAEQLALFAQGRKILRTVNELREEAGLPPITDKENRIVTRNLTSVHQFGCAFDVVILFPPVWDTKADLNENSIPDYEEIGKLGESIGLRWGGRFSFKDCCHFEHTGGLTLADLKTGKRPDNVPARPSLSFSKGGFTPLPPGEIASPLSIGSRNFVIARSEATRQSPPKGIQTNRFTHPLRESNTNRRKGEHMLSGKKTYIVGAAMILYGIAGAAAGKHDFNAAAQLVLQGLGFIGLRLGVSKAELG